MGLVVSDLWLDVMGLVVGDLWLDLMGLVVSDLWLDVMGLVVLYLIAHHSLLLYVWQNDGVLFVSAAMYLVKCI